MMKPKWLLGVLVIAVFMVTFLFQGVNKPSELQPVAGAEDIWEGTLTVHGEGKVSVEPDMAEIFLGAQAVHASADKAQSEVSGKMENIRNVLENYGIKDEQIQTARYNIFPHYEPGPNSEGETQQYAVEHILDVKFEEIPKLGELIDDVTKAGANRVEQTRFTLKDSSAAESEALRKAIENAEPRADVMAESAGRKRGEVLQIADQQAQIDFPVKMLGSAEEMVADSSTFIEAGQIEVIQNVDIVYRLQ